MGLGYREVAAALREAIERGDYPPGSTLPKQAELAEQFSVNIHTVRKAVDMLQAEGRVTPIRRRGTLVRPQPPMKRLGVERYARSKWKFGIMAFGADREASGRDWQPADQTSVVRQVPADAEVADALGVDEEELVYERERLVRDDEVPTHRLTSYYRPADVDDTPLVEGGTGPAGQVGGFLILTLQGLEPDEITEEFHARMPTPDEAATLELPSGEPVMVLRRWTRTAEGRVVEFARGVHAASHFSWSYTFKVPD